MSGGVGAYRNIHADGECGLILRSGEGHGWRTVAQGQYRLHIIEISHGARAVIDVHEYSHGLQPGVQEHIADAQGLPVWRAQAVGNDDGPSLVHAIELDMERAAVCW